MALKFIEGFDWTTNVTHLTGRWTVNSGNASLVVGPFGGRALRCTNTSSNVYLPSFSIDAATNALVMGFRFKREDGNQEAVIGIHQDASVRGMLVKNADGSFKWVVGGTVTTAGLVTTTNTLGISIWGYLELWVQLATTAAGRVKIRLNGQTVDSGAGQTTASGGTTFNRIVFRALNLTVDHYWDDIYIADSTAGSVNDFIGDVQVVQATASGNSTPQDWSALGGGSHVGQIQEATPDGDTSYIFTTTTAQEDRFTHGDLGIISSDTIYGLQIGMHAKDSGTAAPDVKLTMTSSSATSEGSAKALADGAYSSHAELFASDPDGGGTWTKTKADASVIGVKT